MKRCCDELEDFYEAIKDASITTGSGEICGSVDLYVNYKDPSKVSLNISDGWNNIPSLEFRFCPYCGREQYTWVLKTYLTHLREKAT